MSNLSSSYTSIDLSKFKPEEYFKEYHYFEMFDENKEYISKPFKKDFGRGEHTYIYSLYNLNGIEKYIVAKEELSESELKELAPYCRCQYHIAVWYRLPKYFICPCCVGCIRSAFPQQCVINDARKYMNEKKESWC